MDADLAARLQRYFHAYYARQPFDTHRLPPFTLFIPSQPGAELMPFAMPDVSLGDDLGERLAALQDRARQLAGHALPLTFIHEFAPGLSEELARQGYRRAERRVMSCDSSALRSPPDLPGLELLALTASSPESELAAALRVNRRGFNSLDQRITPDDVALFRREIDGGAALLAYVDGVPAAMGEFSAVIDGLTRLAGITTLPEFRRRGIGAALSAELTRLAFASGAQRVFLVARDDPAARVYTAIGYEDCANKVSYHP